MLLSCYCSTNTVVWYCLVHPHVCRAQRLYGADILHLLVPVSVFLLPQPLVLTPMKKRCVIKMGQEKGNDINRAVRLNTFLYVYGYKLWFLAIGFLVRSGKCLQSEFPVGRPPFTSKGVLLFL